MKKKLLVLFGAAALMLSGCGAQTGVQQEAAEYTGPVHALDDRMIAADTEEEAARVTVSASGEIKTTPDMAEITFGVRTTAATPERAQQENTETVSEVLSGLNELGVAETSIQTTDYSLYPRYDDYGEKIVSYQVNTTLTVSDIAISDVGHILTKCTELGCNDIDTIRYFSSTYDEAYAQALSDAVAAAEEKAKALAAASGRRLGEIATMTEGYQDLSLRYTYDTGAAKYAATEELISADAAIMPGEVTVSAQVTVTYRLD